MLQPACATRVMRPLRAHLTEDCTGVQVDQLLAPQFREDVVRLEQHVGRKAEAGRQTVLVSATLSDKVPQTPLQALLWLRGRGFLPALLPNGSVSNQAPGQVAWSEPREALCCRCWSSARTGAPTLSGSG